jgi:hypothetical protein
MGCFFGFSLLYNERGYKALRVNMREGDFYPEEIERLRQAYVEFMEIRSTSSGSAWGEHYKLRLILREMGVYEQFESSSQIENYVEYVITYGRKPDIF